MKHVVISNGIVYFMMTNYMKCKKNATMWTFEKVLVVKTHNVRQSIGLNAVKFPEADEFSCIKNSEFSWSLVRSISAGSIPLRRQEN